MQNYEFALKMADLMSSPMLKILETLEKLEKKITNMPSLKNPVEPTLMDKLAKGANAFNETLLGVQNATAPFTALSQKVAVYSDVLADAQKTTGLTTAQVNKLSDSLSKIDTRTSQKALMDIVRVGGELGLRTPAELEKFTKATNMANVALGDKFGNNAELVAKKMGTLKGLFKETKNMEAHESITRIASSLNAMGNTFGTNAAQTTEFVARMGQLGKMGFNLTDTIGYGVALEKLGLTAEIASGGLANVMLTAGENTEIFAKYLRMPESALKSLINTKPNEFFMRLAASFKNATPTQMEQTLAKLKIGTQESVKVFEALSGNLDLLSQSQKLANLEFGKGTSVMEEYAIKEGTFAAKMEKLAKVFDNVGLRIGQNMQAYLPLIQTTSMLTLTMVQLYPTFYFLGGGVQWLSIELYKGAGAMLTFAYNTTVMLGNNIASFFYSAGASVWRFVVASRAANLSLGQMIWNLGATSFGLIRTTIAWISSSLYGIGMYTAGLLIATTAQIAMNVAMYANPIGAMILGFIALAGAVYLIIRNWDVIKVWLYDLGMFILKYNPFTLLLNAIDYVFGTSILKTLGSWFETITGWLDGIWTKAKDFFNWVTGSAEMVQAVDQKTYTPSPAMQKVNPILETDDWRIKGFLPTVAANTGTELVAKKIDELKGYNDPFKSINPNQAFNELETKNKKGLDSISGGGPKSVTIQLQKLQDKTEIHTTNLTEGATQAENTLLEMLLRVLNGANQAIVN